MQMLAFVNVQLSKDRPLLYRLREIPSKVANLLYSASFPGSPPLPASYGGKRRRPWERGCALLTLWLIISLL